MKSRTKIRVFNRLAMLFCVIEILGLAGIILLVLRYAHIQERSDAFELDRRAVQVMERMEEQIGSVYDIENNLLNDTRLGQVAYRMYSDRYEKSKLLLGIVGSMKSIQSNSVIDDIRVLFPKESVELSALEGYHRQIDETRFSADIRLNEYLLMSGDSLWMRFHYPFILLEGEEPAYVVAVEFIDTFFTAYLDLFRENEQSGAMLLLTDVEDRLYSLYGEEEYQTAILSQWQEHIKRGASDEGYQIEKKIDGRNFYLSYVPSDKYPIVLAVYQYRNVLSRNMASTLFIICCVILVNIIFVMVIFLQTNRSVVRPFYKLMDTFGKVGKGDLTTRIHHNKNDEFQFMYDSFNDMTGNMKQLVLDVREQQKLVANAEFLQLQAQINPHFLYNSFFMIKYMVRSGEYEQVEKVVTTLAEYYRFINKETAQMIFLCDEVRHMESYIYIQQLRFSDRVTVENDSLPIELGQWKVPKLILQPLLENAYQYGVKNLLKDGLIRISYEKDGETLWIHVEDNGRELTPGILERIKQQVYSEEEQDIRHALTNIQRRLLLAYKDPQALTLAIGTLGGLRVTIRLRRIEE